MPAKEQLEEWLLTAGLYQPLSLAVQELAELATFLNLVGMQVDCFCPGCRKESVFNLSAAKLPGFKYDPLRSLTQSRLVSPHDQLLEYFGTHLAQLEFRCARGSAHSLSFYLNINGSPDEKAIVFEKVGQSPSHFALVSRELQGYSKVLDDIDLRELKSAEVCSSHGYHVAAFVYLRRVFERRLEVAHVAALIDSGWDESSYNAKMLRMDERILALRNHLPEFLVKKSKLYGILSTGVHQLTEEQCADAYQTVRVGVTLILDEEIERRERAKKIASAAISLDKLQSKLKGE